MPLSLFIQHLQVLFLFSSEIEEGGENVDKMRKIKTLNVCNFDLALLLVDSKNSLNELNKYESEKMAKVVFLQMYKGINRMRKKIFVIVTSAPPEKKNYVGNTTQVNCVGDIITNAIPVYKGEGTLSP